MNNEIINALEKMQINNPQIFYTKKYKLALKIINNFDNLSTNVRNECIKLLRDDELFNNYILEDEANKNKYIYNVITNKFDNIKIDQYEYNNIFEYIILKYNEKQKKTFDDVYTKAKQLTKEVKKDKILVYFKYISEQAKFYIDNKLNNQIIKKDETIDKLVYLLEYYKYLKTDIIKYLFNSNSRFKNLEIPISRRALILLPKYVNKQYKPYSLTKQKDIQIKQILRNKYTQKIIDLYINNKSINFIQKELTKEAINKKEIPEYIDRYEHIKGSNKTIIRKPLLFPIREIKKILEENNIQIRPTKRPVKK